MPVASWFYWENYRDRVPAHTLAWLIASCFLGVTLPISIWEIVMHLQNMYMPLLQVPVVRVLWMVPIYAVDSWLALRFSWTKYKDISTYICVARECYEAFVVYNFFIFLARYVAISAKNRRRPPRADRDTAKARSRETLLGGSPVREFSASASFESDESITDDLCNMENGEPALLNSSLDLEALPRVDESSEVYELTGNADGLSSVRAVEGSVCARQHTRASVWLPVALGERW